MPRRRLNQSANNFIALLAGKKGDFRIAQNFGGELVAIMPANVGAARFARAGGQARVTAPVRARPNRARTRGKYRAFSARVSAPADARRSSADFRFRVF